MLPNLHRMTAWAKLDDHQHGPLPPLFFSMSSFRLQAVNRPRHQKFHLLLRRVFMNAYYL